MITPLRTRMGLTFAVLAFLFWVEAIVAAPGKHPRAYQLEKSLQQDLEQSLKHYLADRPFSIQVMVDPLRRQPVNEARSSLPLMDIQDNISDEWDDPNRFDYELLARVNRISATLHVPEQTSKAQIEDLKDLIKRKLPFVEGRDLVQVDTKPLLPEDSQPQYYKWILILGSIALLGFAIVNLLTNLVATNRLSKAIKSIKVDVANSNASAGLNHSSAHHSGNHRDPGRVSGGDLQLHDTLKMSELIQSLVSSLDTKQAFPVLQDMLLLEEEIKKNPTSVGALVHSFPDHLRDRVFAFSRSQEWFKVLFDGGILDAKSFELMNRIVKHSRSSESYLQEQLLMRCWALQEKLPEFLRSIESEDAIKILRLLPKGLSVALGREVIPGRWATLLDKSDDKKPTLGIPELKIHQYLKRLNEIQALRDSSVLESYKKDLELVEYLKTLDPIVEKEIYLAAGENSTLYKLRAPFYPVLEASSEQLKGFVSMVGVEDWALALFNVPKAARTPIEKCFSDRQKFMLIDFLKKLDRSQQVDQERMTLARDQIASMWEGYRQTQLVAESSKAHSEDIADAA